MILRIHSENPNKREVSQIVDILRGGGVVIYPTDTLYAFACDINNADAVRRIARIKGIDPETALFSIVCGSISQISTFTTINNATYKMLKGCGLSLLYSKEAKNYQAYLKDVSRWGCAYQTTP